MTIRQGTYAKGAVGYVLDNWKSTAYDFTTRNGVIDQASGIGVYAVIKSVSFERS